MKPTLAWLAQATAGLSGLNQPADRCRGIVTLDAINAPKALQYKVFTGTLRSAGQVENIPDSKLEVVAGELIVEASLPTVLRHVKADTLTLSNIKEYQPKVYYSLSADVLTIDGFEPKVTL